MQFPSGIAVVRVVDVSVIPEGKPLHIYLIPRSGNWWREFVESPVHIDLSMKLVHSVRISRGMMAVNCKLIVANVEGPIANIWINASELVTTRPFYLKVVNLH